MFSARTFLGTFLGTLLGTFLGTYITQRHCYPEDVALVKNRTRARIQFHIVEEVSDTGTQFIGTADLMEEIGDDWILRLRIKICERNHAMMQSLVGIVSEHLTSLYDL